MDFWLISLDLCMEMETVCVLRSHLCWFVMNLSWPRKKTQWGKRTQDWIQRNFHIERQGKVMSLQRGKETSPDMWEEPSVLPVSKTKRKMSSKLKTFKKCIKWWRKQDRVHAREESMNEDIWWSFKFLFICLFVILMGEWSKLENWWYNAIQGKS